MAKLTKYDKDLKRDIVVETNDPAEINKYKWGYGFKEVKLATTGGQSKPADQKNKETK